MEETKVVETPSKFKSIVESIESMSVLDLHELVKHLEEKFGVSAAAVAVAAPAGGAAAGASVQTTLQGDAAYPVGGVTNATTVQSDTNNDFIWSPNTTTASTPNTVDWSNGYGVTGLPGTYMSAEVLSK